MRRIRIINMVETKNMTELVCQSGEEIDLVWIDAIE